MKTGGSEGLDERVAELAAQEDWTPIGGGRKGINDTRIPAKTKI